MVNTAPARRADLLDAFPELLEYGRVAARLHPRPGEPGERESSVGGPLLWPGTEPWPTCAERHLVVREAGPAEEGEDAAMHRLIASLGARFSSPPEPVPMVPVLQLFRADAPGAIFPEADLDLVQILWCPQQHEQPARGPRPAVFWRRTAEVVPGPERPRPAATALVPVPCVVHPEEVVEFPWLSQGYGYAFGPSPVPDGLQQRIQEWNGHQPKGFDYHALAIAPGWKVGGWDLQSPVCDCGAAMVMLFQTSAYEYLSGGWTPHEEPDFRWGAAEDEQPTGVRIGREECLTIHLCPTDREHPLHTTVN